MQFCRASLPMYDWPELASAHQAFWRLFNACLENSGIDLPQLDSGDGESDWLKPDLFLSQTCGYPYATQLRGKVQLVGTPHFAVEGCTGPRYSSAVIVRKDASYNSVKDARRGNFAYNGTNSMSGYRCLKPLVGDPVGYFSISTESGGHRTSATMVATEEADLAAIDSVCWHHLKTFEPGLAAKLKVLTWTASVPALPFITSNVMPSNQLANVRAALREAIFDSASDDIAGQLGMRDLTVLADDDYAPLGALK